MSAVGFRRMITKLGKAAKMPFSVHPHMLRHACGFKLANDGHDTVRLRRRRPGGTCPPQPQCAAINAQRLRRTQIRIGPQPQDRHNARLTVPLLALADEVIE
jgi:hypothetical protein